MPLALISDPWQRMQIQDADVGAEVCLLKHNSKID